MTEPMFSTAIAAALESAVNGALRLDPGSRHAVAALSGRVLAVELRQPSLIFYLLPGDDRLTIASHYEGAVETRLRGSPMALANLLGSERLNLAGSGVEVSGSSGLLAAWQKIIHNLDLDWEEPLSRVLGDVAGPQGARSLRAFGGWFEGRRATFERLLGEYLSEELKSTPARAELEHFYRDVDDLRLATDRLTARIEAIKVQAIKVQAIKVQAIQPKS